jgi:hypothetical protein
MFAETLDTSQYSTPFAPESRSYILKAAAKASFQLWGTESGLNVSVLEQWFCVTDIRLIIIPRLLQVYRPGFLQHNIWLSLSFQHFEMGTVIAAVKFSQLWLSACMYVVRGVPKRVFLVVPTFMELQYVYCLLAEYRHFQRISVEINCPEILMLLAYCITLAQHTLTQCLQHTHTHTHTHTYIYIYIYLAVPLHAMEALGGRGGIAPTHSRPRH